jgi:hypothetical protein
MLTTVFTNISIVWRYIANNNETNISNVSKHIPVILGLVNNLGADSKEAPLFCALKIWTLKYPHNFFLEKKNRMQQFKDLNHTMWEKGN